MIGTTLGPYRILDKLGEGGMGEVYRATDTHLKRQVALKVLPAAVAADPDRLARFQREAEVLAALNHPHIAQIYGLEQGATIALVMELVEGPTLADRVARGPVPIDEALSIAKQIAAALQAAHDQGIIHRDLKPANIKVRPDGTVKVLDFGLAKAIEGVGRAGAAGREKLSQSPTITTPAMTHAGMILGTAAYMSPEQARGFPVGVQADIWAFGCVFYEMLTGRSPFSGPTVTDVLAAVVRADPEWAALPPDTPASVRSLLRRCLQKDLSRRLHHMGDVRIELEEPVPDAPAAPASRASSKRTVWWIAAPLSAIALALAALAFTARSVTPPSELRVDVVTANSLDLLSIALSRDGLKLAYTAASNGVSHLQVRSLTDGSVKSLAGTDFASLPFWSPDGRSLGFFADGNLKRIDVAEGLIQTLAPAPLGSGGSWNADGVVIYAPTLLGGLFKIPARGGAPVELRKLVPNKEVGHRSPHFLADGQRYIYFVGGDAGVAGVYLASLDGSTEPKRLLDADTAVAMGSDHLLFVRQGTLFAQAWRADRGELTGTPVALASAVFATSFNNVAPVTAATGASALAYRSGAASTLRQLAWFDRAGRSLGDVGGPDPAGVFNPELAPDGRFVAVNRTIDNNLDVWLIDTARGTRRRFTFDTTTDQIPVWSPDGQRIVFSSNRAGAYNLYEKPSERPGAEQLLLETNENKFPMGFSGDGRYLLYRNTAPNTDWDLWALPLSGEKKAFPVVKTPFQELMGELSADGKWIAYQTNESGQFEIFVQSFPDPTTRTQVSTAGGSQPRWRRDGKELFFIALDGRLMATPIEVNANHFLEAGAPEALFLTHTPGGAVPSPQKQQYAVSPDGQRFLLNNVPDEAGSTSVSLILNWHPPAAK